MNRLVHSGGGFLRALQMSSAQVFAFVEGRLDRAFFDRLLQRVLVTSGLRHQVVAVKELPPNTGGKRALLDLFLRFRKQDRLEATAFGKEMVCMFFVDKDADDYLRRLKRSPHIIYSRTYDLEGHLGSCGDLQRALADACGVTYEQAVALLPSSQAFFLEVGSRWSDWIALCLISQKLGVNCGSTFDRISQINSRPLDPPNVLKLQEFKTEIAKRLGLEDWRVEREFRLARQAVDRAVASNDPLRFFKGKWLAHVFQCHLEGSPKPADANFQGIWDRIETSLLAQVPPTGNCSCCAHYENAVLGLVARFR